MIKGIDKNGWTKVCFGEVCRNLNITERDPEAAGIDRYVGLEHIEPGSLHIKSWGNVADGTTFTKRFSPGHVLFGKRRAYQRKAAVAKFEGICSGDILVFEAIEEVMDPDLLPFLVHSDRFFDFAVQTSAGSLSPRTKFQDLAKFEFLLPPKAEQARLAELLWAADELTKRYEMFDSKLQSAKDGMFYDLLKQSDRNILLDEIASVSYGMGVPPKVHQNGVPVIRATNISKGAIFGKDLLKVLPEEINSGKRVFLDEGDLIVVRSGAYTGDIGYITKEWKGSLAGYDLVIKPNRDKILPIFLKAYLLSKPCQAYFKAESIRSAQPHLNAEQVRNTTIPFIDETKQIDFVNTYFEFQANIKNTQTILSIMILQRNRLINSIFA